MGGIIGALACAAGRFKPGSLLLLDSAIPVAAERRPFLAELGARMLACADADAMKQRQALERLSRDYVLQHLASPHDDRDTLDQIIEHMAGGDASRCGSIFKAASVVDFAPALRRIDARVSAIAADPARLPIDGFRACRPTSEVMQIRRVGHFVQLLAPSTVNAAILCMLDGSPLRGAGLEPVTAAAAAATSA